MSNMSNLALQLDEICAVCNNQPHCAGCRMEVKDQDKKQLIVVNGWNREIIGVYDLSAVKASS